jgi:histidinol phosphatase-like enzyme
VIVFVDIDETICKTPESRDYRDSQPIKENIKKINLLYEQGHTVIYWTARGSGTGLDWRDVTEKQFEDWGVKCHELRLGKPVYDIFIDDRNVNAETFFKSVGCFE